MTGPAYAERLAEEAVAAGGDAAALKAATDRRKTGRELRPLSEKISKALAFDEIVGSALGSWLTTQFGYKNSNGGFEIIPFIVGIICAMVLITIYLTLVGRKNRV